MLFPLAEFWKTVLVFVDEALYMTRLKELLQIGNGFSLPFFHLPYDL